MTVFTEIKEGLGISLSALYANKLRSTLTALGIVIGVTAVTLLSAVINGLVKQLDERISLMGGDVLTVERYNRTAASREEIRDEHNNRRITLKQAEALRTDLAARNIAPVGEVWDAKKFYYKDHNQWGYFIGTTADYISTGGFELAEGRFMTPKESEGGRPVCILGSDLAAGLFGQESPIGKKIKVSNLQLRVIGVVAKQGIPLSADKDFKSLDGKVITTVQQCLNAGDIADGFSIQVKVLNPEQMDDAREDLRSSMRRVRHIAPSGRDDFVILQTNDYSDFILRGIKPMIGVGLLITGLSLFVGAIGTMNIMFVSVTERTWEIGVRKTLGAKSRTILLQFLIEALVISLLGGLIALAVTYPLTLLASNYATLTISLPVIGLALLISLLTGVAAGFFPALRAARMKPVDALRTD